MKSCLLCGVGGQGTVLASRIIAEAAMNKGFFVRTAETIGMAQRGGCVVSHVRFGPQVPSSTIPFGQADVIIGFEPGEAVRSLPYLKPDGVVVVCSREISPVTASLSGAHYSGQEMIRYLKAHVRQCHVLDPEEIFQRCGTSRVLNVALLGAMAACGAMNLTVDDVMAALEKKMKPQYFEMNKQALLLGAQCV